MLRTQIYLSEKAKEELSHLNRETGKGQSAIIREAIDQYLERHRSSRRQSALENAVGLWKDRRDLPDFGKLRGEWDRKGKT